MSPGSSLPGSSSSAAQRGRNGACWGWRRAGRGSSTPQEAPGEEAGPALGRSSRFLEVAPGQALRSTAPAEAGARAPPPGSRSLSTDQAGSRKPHRSRCKGSGWRAGPSPPGQAACSRPPAEATYSSRGSQLRAALARGIQIDVFTLTSLLAGVFTLGETGREERQWAGPSSHPLGSGGRPAGLAWSGMLPYKEDGELCSTLPGRASPGSEDNAALTTLVSGRVGTQVSCWIFSKGKGLGHSGNCPIKAALP